MSCSWCTERFLPNTPATESGNFQITSLAARNLTNIRHFSRRMKVHAEVFIKGDGDGDGDAVGESMKTGVDKEGDTDPTWNNLACEFTVDEKSVLTVELYCDRTRGDKCIGSVEIQVGDLLPQKPEETEATAVYNVGNWSLEIKYKTSLSTELPYPYDVGLLVLAGLVPIQ